MPKLRLLSLFSGTWRCGLIFKFWTSYSSWQFQQFWEWGHFCRCLNTDFGKPIFGHLFLKILAYICGENLSHEKIPTKLSWCRCICRYTCACINTWHHQRVLLASPSLAVLGVSSVLPCSPLPWFSQQLCFWGCWQWTWHPLCFWFWKGAMLMLVAIMLCLWITKERIRARKRECHCSKRSLGFA